MPHTAHSCFASFHLSLIYQCLINCCLYLYLADQCHNWYFFLETWHAGSNVRSAFPFVIGNVREPVQIINLYNSPSLTVKSCPTELTQTKQAWGNSSITLLTFDTRASAITFTILKLDPPTPKAALLNSHKQNKQGKIPPWRFSPLSQEPRPLQSSGQMWSKMSGWMTSCPSRRTQKVMTTSKWMLHRRTRLSSAADANTGPSKI